MPTNPILQLLMEGRSLSTAQVAELLSITETEVEAALAKLREQGIFLGWRPVLNLAKHDSGMVRAVIEVKIRPERGGGFNRLAERIARFDEVDSCYLMSGGYDLLVFINGPSLTKVAGFISERLSTIEGVLSTATHFMLRSYKESGFLLDQEENSSSRLKVTP